MDSDFRSISWFSKTLDLSPKERNLYSPNLKESGINLENENLYTSKAEFYTCLAVQGNRRHWLVSSLWSLSSDVERLFEEMRVGLCPGRLFCFTSLRGKDEWLSAAPPGAHDLEPQFGLHWSRWLEFCPVPTATSLNMVGFPSLATS